MSEPQPWTDADLMARMGQGDAQALGLLVDRHKDAMVNYLTRLTGSRDRGEDMAQEAFLRLYQAAPRYREDGRLVPYLYRIATNLVRSEDRRRRRFRLVSGLLSVGGSQHHAPVGPSRLLRQEERVLLTRALGELPLVFRVPLVLCAVEGWSYESIAEFLSTSVGTVKSRIHRGKERLRTRLAPYRQGGVA
jgi:RNA polymerase sigma-70 factor (ECF subfamily)